MSPLKKTNASKCIERSSSTRSTDYSPVIQTDVPHLYTDSTHRYSIQTSIKDITMVKVYILWPCVVSSGIIHLFTEN